MTKGPHVCMTPSQPNNFQGLSLREKIMKIWTSEHVFNHPWDTLTSSQWQKYPNPHNTSVLRTDVVDRVVTSDGILESHRLITSDWSLAPWVQRIIGSGNSICYAHEYSTVDPSQKVMKMRSVNLTFCNLVSMEEKMSYTVHPNDSSKTVLNQETVVTVQGVPLTSYMESIIVNIVNANAMKGRKAMDWVIGRVNEESKFLSSKLETLKTEINDLKNLNLLHNKDLIQTAKRSIEEMQRDLKKSIQTIHVQAQEVSSSPADKKDKD